ncbi:MAG: adenosine deaminase [Actinomycetia bacterium]|nr:adenosine deaminase [Actinomycetes bacterium]
MTSRDLATLPKAHLHIHLEGGMRPETLVELAAAAGIPVPEVRGYGSFSVFAAMYVAACEVLRSPEDLRRLVFEVVEDSAVAGAVWVEPSIYAPHHAQRIGPPDEVMEILLEAGREAGEHFGIGVGWMVAADRTADPADAVAQAELAIRFRDQGVVSFGLANDEAIGPPEWFGEAFTAARDAGLLSTPHAGELAGPESVIGALDVLGADRIQHGVRAVEQPGLVDRIADSGVCLDVCPTSNVLLSVVPSIGAHPLPQLIAAGVRCSLNADDPLLFGPGLLEEYEVARSDLALDDDALAFVARSSVDASGASDTLKADTNKAIDAWLAS